MTTDPLDEFRAALANPLADHLGVPLRAVEEALAAVTEDWTAKRKGYPNRDQHPLEDDRYGHRVTVSLPFMPESDEDRAEREVRQLAFRWAYNASLLEWDDWDGADQLGPPPERVSVSQLLDQCHWWRPRERVNAPGEQMRLSERTVAMRLADMDHGHRLALLRWLRARAEKYKNRADWTMAGGPHPSGDAACDAFEAACDEQFAQLAEDWLEQQPLVRALVRWTTPYGESPLTWRPISEAPRDGTLFIARWSDLPDYDDLPIRWFSHDVTWVPAGAEGYGGFDDDPDVWRELYEHERCPHGVPLVEDDGQRIEYCPQCDHGHDCGRDDDCGQCYEAMERMDH